MLVNVYSGVFFDDSFCPKGFVLLDGQQVYLSILFENCVEKWGVHYNSGAHYTQVNMVYLHITYTFPTLSGKKGTVVKLSLTVFNNSKSLSSFRFFLSLQPAEEKKILPFLKTVMKTGESFQATYVATSVPKTVSLLKENQDDLRQEFQESNLHCFYSRICIL